jgi:hypothetical protein
LGFLTAKRKWIIIAGVVLLVIIIAAATAGGVVGSRNRNAPSQRYSNDIESFSNFSLVLKNSEEDGC